MSLPRPSAIRVASAYRAALNCRKVISLAWIDPQGRVHELGNNQRHEEWALDYLWKTEPRIIPSKDTAEHFLFFAAPVLFEKGWLRLMNYRSGEYRGSKARKALETMAQVHVDCLLSKREDPERVEVEVWNGSRDVRLTSAEFVERFGAPGLADAMFEKLLANV